MTSKATKHARLWRNLFGALSYLCNFGLIIAFTIWGLIQGTQVTRYTMCIAAVVGIILAVVSVILKKHWITPLIILIGGLYFAITQFAEVLITLAVCIVADELVFQPLHKHFKAKTMINREIDKRYAE